jgi:hypothetical protein
VTEQDRRDLAELVASRRIMVEQIGQHIDWLVTTYGISPSEAAERARTLAPFDPFDEPPDHLDWLTLTNALEADAERGQALWQRVKEEAREEVRLGVRAVISLERRLHATPWERAQLLAIVGALTDALHPRNALEVLLVQQMACAYEQHLRWQTRAAQRVEEEAWQGERDQRRALERMSPQQRERYQEREGWLPPRQADAAAIEQAVLIADRYQRAFLRLLKAFRENRRLFDSLIVAGGQVNIGQQQRIEQPAPRSQPRVGRRVRAPRRAGRVQRPTNTP